MSAHGALVASVDIRYAGRRFCSDSDNVSDGRGDGGSRGGGRGWVARKWHALAPQSMLARSGIQVAECAQAGVPIGGVEAAVGAGAGRDRACAVPPQR